MLPSLAKKAQFRQNSEDLLNLTHQERMQVLSQGLEEVLDMGVDHMAGTLASKVSCTRRKSVWFRDGV
jgi:hypothetical protein